MDLCGHFEYGGISSRKYGLILVNALTERTHLMSGTINAQTVFNKTNKRKYIIGSDFSESPSSFDIEIISETDKPLEMRERREIEKWLFYTPKYQKLYLDIADDYLGETYELVNGEPKRLYLNCRFINPERLEYNGGIVGYKATVECDSGFWTQDAIVQPFIINNPSESDNTTIQVIVDTDLKDYVYPKVTIQIGDKGGDITIINNTDDSARLTKFIGLSPAVSLVMKGETNYISGQNYHKFAFQNFIRLLDGANTITLFGNIDSIEFEYENKRFL